MKIRVLLAVWFVCSAAWFACTQNAPATEASFEHSVDVTATMVAGDDAASPEQITPKPIVRSPQPPILLPTESLLAEVSGLVQRMEEREDSSIQEGTTIVNTDSFVALSQEEVKQIIGYTPAEYRLISARIHTVMPGEPVWIRYLGPVGAQLSLLEHPFGVEGRRLPIEFTEEIVFDGQSAFVTRGNVAEQHDSIGTTITWDQSARLSFIFWRGGSAYELYIEPGGALPPDELMRMAESVRG